MDKFSFTRSTLWLSNVFMISLPIMAVLMAYVVFIEHRVSIDLLPIYFAIIAWIPMSIFEFSGIYILSKALDVLKGRIGDKTKLAEVTIATELLNIPIIVLCLAQLIIDLGLIASVLVITMYVARLLLLGRAVAEAEPYAL